MRARQQHPVRWLVTHPEWVLAPIAIIAALWLVLLVGSTP